MHTVFVASIWPRGVIARPWAFKAGAKGLNLVLQTIPVLRDGCLQLYSTVHCLLLIMASITVLSLNCHGFNVGTSMYLNRVNKHVDIILLQETWPCDATCNRLVSAFDDYDVYHTSAMEQKFSSGVFSGRPFGGTAVMVHKKMSRCISQVITDCYR